MNARTCSLFARQGHTYSGGPFPLYSSEDVRTDTVCVRIFARVQDDLAAAIIHFGTSYPGPRMVLHIEADDLHGVRESEESVDDVRGE